MYFRKEIGKWGENLACKYLEERNYKIIERNFLCRQGEIDIVAKDIMKRELVFVKVKTRTDLKYGNPDEAITNEKLKHMKRTAKYFIYRNNLQNVAIRVDVMEVLIEKQECMVNHIKQVEFL